MNKPSEIQLAYDALMKAMEGMAKDAKGWKVSDISAVKNMTTAIKNLKSENQALRNELEALKAVPRQMANNAAECEEHFLGGYQSKEELDIFVHGMRTVASCMESYANKLEQGND